MHVITHENIEKSIPCVGTLTHVIHALRSTCAHAKLVQTHHGIHLSDLRLLVHKCDVAHAHPHESVTRVWLPTEDGPECAVSLSLVPAHAGAFMPHAVRSPLLCVHECAQCLYAGTCYIRFNSLVHLVGTLFPTHSLVSLFRAAAAIHVARLPKPQRARRCCGSCCPTGVLLPCICTHTHTHTHTHTYI